MNSTFTRSGRPPAARAGPAAPAPGPWRLTADGSQAEPDPAVLQALVEQLRESEARFRIMADCSPVLLWMSEADGLCSFFNKGWLEFTGRTVEQEMGNGWAEGVHAEDFEFCMHTYLEAFVQRQAFRMEYRLRRADGEFRWQLDTGVPRFTPGGHFAGYVGSCVDITEIREAQQALKRVNEDLERRVAARTAELSHTNEELEQFAYVASHDLQAPLRAITGYINLLQRRYQGRFDHDADEFFGFIAEGAHRMQQLIRDLLAYSRTTRSSDDHRPVDCRELLGEILETLAPTIAERHARLQVGELPTVPGDRLLLMQLFQNLIDNALKFCRADTPEVQITAQRRADGWQFTVADNGIGIAPEYVGRLFRVFQRLHNQEEYPGTGIGLAICRKVVERHGGRIWIESAPEQGSRVHFTLAGALPEPHS